MNARTELAPEGWGLGDVMRPAARGRGRGLPPPVTSWGFGAGPARPTSRWGADSHRRGGGAESRAHGGAGRAREPPCPLPARARALSRAGRGGGRLGGVCLRAENSGSLGSLLRAGAEAGAARAAPSVPQFPSSGTRKLGQTLRALPDSRNSASSGKRSLFSGNSGGGSPAPWKPSRGRIPSLPFLPLLHFIKVRGAHSSRSRPFCWEGKPLT